LAVFNCFQGELQDERDLSYEGGLKVLRFLLLGLCEALPPARGISRLSKQLSSLVKSLNSTIKTLGPDQCRLIIDILEFVCVLEARKDELEDLSEVARFDTNIVLLCLQAEAFGNSDCREQAEKNIKAIFSIAGRDSGIFKEILQDVQGDYIEKWHEFDETVS
jgi:hypothetical protein